MTYEEVKKQYKIEKHFKNVMRARDNSYIFKIPTFLRRKKIETATTRNFPVVQKEEF